MSVTPCKGCEERYIGCHDSCLKYGAWKEEREKVKQKRREYYDERRFIHEVSQGGIKKCKK